MLLLALGVGRRLERSHEKDNGGQPLSAQTEKFPQVFCWRVEDAAQSGHTYLGCLTIANASRSRPLALNAECPHIECRLSMGS
jgi:hypothetical protein